DFCIALVRIHPHHARVIETGLVALELLGELTWQAGPFTAGDHVANQADQQGAGIATLETELTAEVAELAELAAAEAGNTAAEALVVSAAAEAVEVGDATLLDAAAAQAQARAPLETGRATGAANTHRTGEPKWILERRAQVAERERSTEDLQVLLQADGVHRTRNRDDQVGHFVGPNGLFADRFLTRRDLDKVTANEVSAVDRRKHEPEHGAERDTWHLRQFHTGLAHILQRRFERLEGRVVDDQRQVEAVGQELQHVFERSFDGFINVHDL